MQQLQIKQRHEPRALQEQVGPLGRGGAGRAAVLVLFRPELRRPAVHCCCAQSNIGVHLLGLFHSTQRTERPSHFIAPRCAALQVEAEYAAAVRGKNPKRPLGFERLPEAAPPTTNVLLDFKSAKKNKKRCGQGGGGRRALGCSTGCSSPPILAK